MKVYQVTLKASFYVLAESRDGAESAAKEYSEFDEIEACLPAGSWPDFVVYETPNQEPVIRQRAANYDYVCNTKGKAVADGSGSTVTRDADG